MHKRQGLIIKMIKVVLLVLSLIALLAFTHFLKTKIHGFSQSTISTLSLQERIEDGKQFLLNMENKEKGGFYKYYYPETDTVEERLYGPYSASIIYTLLKVYSYDHDPSIALNVKKWASFLLSLQNSDGKSGQYGAFAYSYYLSSDTMEKQYVSGTSALSIMTLLKLYEFTHDPKYVVAAKLAGNWLLTMQKPDGSITDYVMLDDKKQVWLKGTKESFLYDGQALTAFSRLYKATGEKKYYDAALKMASRFVDLYEKEHDYIQDDYRKKNSISNAWVVMSLMEFYKNTNQDEKYRQIIFELANIIYSRKVDEEKNEWIGSPLTSSGNAWLAEVFSEVYTFCQTDGRSDCLKYKKAVILDVVWLQPFTYSKENPMGAKNITMATGGIKWRDNENYVRTDIDCHALNSYINLINMVK